MRNFFKKTNSQPQMGSFICSGFL